MAFDKTLNIEHLNKHDRLEIIQMFVTGDCCCLWGIFWDHIMQDRKHFDSRVTDATTVGDLYSLVNEYI